MGHRRPAQSATRRAPSLSSRLAALEATIPALSREPVVERFVDLCLTFVVYDPAAPDHNGEYLFSVGGVWDRETKAYVKPPSETETCRVVRIHPGQLAAARHFGAWLEARRARAPRDAMIYLGGQRRSGKGYLGLAIALALAIEVPGFPAFLVSGTEKRRGELDRDLAEHPERLYMPADWYDYDVGGSTYHLANGSTIQHVSGARHANAKQGGASCVLINEGQEMRPRVAAFALPAIGDTGGLVVMACNPPLPGSPGEWVLRIRKSILKGRLRGSVYQLEAAHNPFVDRAQLAAANEFVAEIDPRVAQADASGEWDDIVDRAYPRWRDEYVIELPDVGLRDVTAQVTGRKASARSHVIGLDFQGGAYMAAVIWRLYAGFVTYEAESGLRVEVEGTPDAPLWIATGEVVLPLSDDEGLIAELGSRGLLKSSLFVGDASGVWQSATHNREEPASFKAFRSAGALIVPPRKKQSTSGFAPANPRIAERLGLMSVLMRSPRVFIEGRREGREIVPLAPTLAAGFAACELATSRRNTTRVPIGTHAHITDAATYALYWGEADRFKSKVGTAPAAGSFAEHAPSAAFNGGTPRGGFPGLTR